MQNLERNKRFYERNSMVIFGHMKNEENIKVIFFSKSLIYKSIIELK